MAKYRVQLPCQGSIVSRLTSLHVELVLFQVTCAPRMGKEKKTYMLFHFAAPSHKDSNRPKR